MEPMTLPPMPSSKPLKEILGMVTGLISMSVMLMVIGMSTGIATLKNAGISGTVIA